jgi:hypothetical protein
MLRGWGSDPQLMATQPLGRRPRSSPIKITLPPRANTDGAQLFVKSRPFSIDRF